MRLGIRSGIVSVLVAALLCGQAPQGGPPPQPATPQAEPAKPEAAQPEPAQQAPAQAPAIAEPGPSGGLVLNLQNASLTEVIDILARRLRLNYILDPRVKGSVNLNTYGELKEVDVRSLLDIILRINGATLIQLGEIYRIVPLTEASRMPLPPQLDKETFPDNEQTVLNLVFLKYAAAGELAKLLDKFLGEGATMITYDPANLLVLLDNNRNMQRTMELIALFDSDTLASQRVRLFEVKNGRPSDITKELETILRGISLVEKAGAVRFLPLDRINTIIAVAPNPGVFDEVEQWLKKLDVPVKVTAGSMDNYVYRVKYGQADTMAIAIMQLYLGLFLPPGFGYGGFGGGMGGFSPYGGFGMGQGYGMPGVGYPGVGYGGGYGAGYPGGLGLSSPLSRRGMTGAVTQSPEGGAAGAVPQPGAAGIAPGSPDLTGMYLGGGGYGYGIGIPEGIPKVVPNPFDNSLLIQATPQQYEQILKLLDELDVPPRQVLIEAKIYEVSLTGAFASGVQAFIQRRGQNDLGVGSPLSSLSTRTPQIGSSAGLTLTAGALVGQSRELLALLTAQEDTRRAKIISAPSVIATDSIQATINVGQEVPTLTSQALTGAQVGGSSLFANTVQTRNSGVTLSILARVNPSGIVTLVINQEVSAPVPPSADSAIQSPSFSKRTVQTQVTVQDGDTIAIGGIIQETDTWSSAGIPVLHRLPGVGALFGNRSISKERTELIVFMTPRVIYDTNMIIEASEELKSKLRRLSKILRE